MSTIFTRIINGEVPGTFVWRDDQCGAFMSINPLRSGHVWWYLAMRSTIGSTVRRISETI